MTIIIGVCLPLAVTLYDEIMRKISPSTYENIVFYLGGQRPLALPSLTLLREDNESFWQQIQSLREEAANNKEPMAEFLCQFQQEFGAKGQVTIITERADEVLQKSGCTNVVQLRGSLFRFACTDSRCGLTPFADDGESGATTHCPICSSSLRPTLLLKDEDIDGRVEWHAKRALKGCQLLVVLVSQMNDFIKSYVQLVQSVNGRTVLVTPKSLGLGVAAQWGFSDERVGKLEELFA